MIYCLIITSGRKCSDFSKASSKVVYSSANCSQVSFLEETDFSNLFRSMLRCPFALNWNSMALWKFHVRFRRNWKSRVAEHHKIVKIESGAICARQLMENLVNYASRVWFSLEVKSCFTSLFAPNLGFLYRSVKLWVCLKWLWKFFGKHNSWRNWKSQT